MCTHDQLSIHAEDEIPELCRKIFLKPADIHLLDIDDTDYIPVNWNTKMSCFQKLVTGFNQKISHFFQSQEGLTFMKELIKMVWINC